MIAFCCSKDRVVTSEARTIRWARCRRARGSGTPRQQLRVSLEAGDDRQGGDRLPFPPLAPASKRVRAPSSAAGAERPIALAVDPLGELPVQGDDPARTVGSRFRDRPDVLLRRDDLLAPAANTSARPDVPVPSPGPAGSPRRSNPPMARRSLPPARRPLPLPAGPSARTPSRRVIPCGGLPGSSLMNGISPMGRGAADSRPGS